jgi:hypothetical protein
MSISVSKESLQIAKRNSSKFLRNLCHFHSVLRYYGAHTLYPLHSTRRMQCMSISVSKQYLQIAKRNLSNFDEDSVISFLIEMFRRLRALSTPFYTPNVLHVDISVETIPGNRKTQSIKFLRNIYHFLPDCDTTAFIRSFHSIIHTECSACRFQCRKNPCKSQNAILSNFYEISVIFVQLWDVTAFISSFHSILHAERIALISVSKTAPANRQTQSFKLRRKLCCFVPH